MSRSSSCSTAAVPTRYNCALLLLLFLAGFFDDDRRNNASSFVFVKKVDACTVFIVGKDASADGSVLVSHSNDGEFDTDPRLVKIPPSSSRFGSSSDGQQQRQQKMRPIFFSPESYPRYVGTDRGNIPPYAPVGNQKPFEPIGFVPEQQGETFAYLEDTYGAVNERQVGIGESTCSGVFGAVPLGMPNGTALLSVDQLTQIAMERASTAESAVRLMGSLAERYGFYGAGQFEGTAESLAVSDADEVWIFHILPDPTGRSAIWAAQRVPSDGFAVLANMFVIRQVDPSDTRNFLMSDSVHRVAQDYGWWNSSGGELLDFTKIYSDGEYAHKYYSVRTIVDAVGGLTGFVEASYMLSMVTFVTKLFYQGRRMWGAYHLACPSKQFPSEYKDLQSDPVYPVWAVPDKPISQQDLFRYHRYTYQNTQFDLGAAGNLAAGPFGSPDRWKAGVGETQVNGNWVRTGPFWANFRVSYIRNESHIFARFWNYDRNALLVFIGPLIRMSCNRNLDHRLGRCFGLDLHRHWEPYLLRF